MQASQLTAINNAKNLLEQCGCFRGPPGPTGPTGSAGKTLYYYSDGINTDPNAAGVDPCVYGLFIGTDGALWRSSPAIAIDGSFTASLLNGTVRTIAKQSTGKIVVGGDFTLYNATSYNYIIRFNNDGSVDSSFSIGTGFDASVRAIAIQSDDKILVGGDFGFFNGSTYRNIIRLNSDGTVDSTFNSVPGFDGSVYSIVVRSDNKIYVGGSFSFYNSQASPSIIRLTSAGFTDTLFNIGLGFNGPVYSISIQSDDSLIVGGAFNGYNGAFTQNNIIHLLDDGTYESSNFVSGTGFNNSVYFIKLLSNSNLLIVGAFTNYNGTSVSYSVELYANGTIASVFTGGFNALTRVAKVDLSNNFLFGGDFTSYSGNSNGYITRTDSNGSYLSDYPVITGFNNSVYDIYSESYNQFLVAGSFTSYDSSTSKYIVRLKEKPCSWINTGTNILGNTSNTSTFIYALVSTTNGLGTIGYVSTSQLTSTVRGLGTIGYISTSQLQSTISGLGNLGYLSTAGSVTLNNLTSTVIGLGTFGYISSSQLQSTVAGLGTATSVTSTIIGLGNLGYISSTQLQSTVRGLATSGYVSTSQLTSTFLNLSHAGYVSSTQLASTVMGLGNIGYISTSQLTSTLRGLGTAGYISSATLQSTISGLGNLGYLSSIDTSLVSTIRGLGTAGYISSSQLISSVTGLGNIYLSSSATSQTAINSTIVGLGTFGYISSATLESTISGLGATVLPSTITGLGTFGYLSTNTTPSTITGLGTFGYISSSQLISTVTGLGNIYLSSGGASQGAITSTIVGLGTFGYISSSQLISSVIGLGNIYLSSGGASQTAINSTITGLGTFGYISSATLQSTISGLGATVLPSTITGLGTFGYLSTNTIPSTIVGLGTFGYISSATLQSTISGLGATVLPSTIIGLGTFGYLSTSQLTSTVRGLGSIYLSTFTGSTTYLSSAVGFISSLTVNSLTVGNGAGWVDFGAIRAVIVSSIQTNTGLLNASSIAGDGSQIYNLPAISTASLQSTIVGLGTFGYLSTNTIPSTIVGLGTFGYLSSFNTISSLNISSGNLFASLISTQNINASTMRLDKLFAGPSIGATTTQNLYPFSAGATLGFGSNTAQSGFYGEGHFRSTFTQVIQPTLDNDGFSNVVLINGNVSTANIFVSTVTANTISTSNISSFFYGGIEKYNYISSIALQSSIVGLGTTGYISSSQLTSSIAGLGRFYLSTFAGSTTYLSSAVGFISSLNVNSLTIGSGTGFVDFGAIRALLVSTIQTNTGVLNASSIIGDGSQIYNLPAISSLSLQSTVVGLGTAGYISSTQLFSTVAGLISTPKIFIIQTFTF